MVGTYALANQPKAPEIFYPHFFSKMNVVNVATGPGQGMFYYFAPDLGWRGELCGEANYTREDGSVIQLTCAGPKHVHWRDLDSSLIGTIGSISGNFQDSPRVFPMDQGMPVLPGPCTYSSVLGSYSCVTGSSSFLLDAPMKPSPIPAEGIWGDPQHFVLESRDKDSEDRNFGPVFFNVSGSIDLVTVQQDHGCCFTYKCQKRLSTFGTYVPTGQTVYINFTGTPAQIFRLWLPYADPDKEIVVVINYLSTLNRRFVVLPQGVSNITGRITPELSPPKIGDGKGHGAYYWDQFHTLMYVKMTGGKHLEIRTENAVQVSQSFALTVEQFYDIEELFLSNLAYAMNITRDRLYIVKVVAGSVAVTFAIAPPLQDVPELTFAEGRDASDANDTLTVPVAEPPVVLTPEDIANLTLMGASAPPIENLTLSTLLVLRQLWSLFSAYTAVAEAVTQSTNVTLQGLPTQYIPPFFTTTPANTSSPSTLPGSSPPLVPDPPTVIPVGNSGGGDGSGGGSGNTAGTSGGGGGSGNTAGTSGGDATSGMNSSPPRNSFSDKTLGAIIGGTIGGVCLVLTITIFAIQRHRAKKINPTSLPAGVVEMPAESVDVSEGSTLPTATGPGAVSERERQLAVSSGSDATRPMSPRAAVHASSSNASGAAATGSLAAGLIAPSEPEAIRPLASTNKQPHNSTPLVLVQESSTVAIPEGEQSRRESIGAVITKAPAELQRAESLLRYSAPQVSELAPQGDKGCPSQSIVDGRPASARPGSGRTGFMAPPSDMQRVPEASGPEQTAPGTTVASAVEGGETVVVRALETQESWRPKSRATSSRPPSGGVVYAAGPEDMVGEGWAQGQGQVRLELVPGEPNQPLQEVRRRISSPPQPTMMLPGGMMEFAASPSLLRSDVAAMMVAAGSSQGLGTTAAAATQEEQQGSPQAARTPAGLRSDSMRWKEHEQD